MEAEQKTTSAVTYSWQVHRLELIWAQNDSKFKADYTTINIFPVSNSTSHPIIVPNMLKSTYELTNSLVPLTNPV